MPPSTPASPTHPPLQPAQYRLSQAVLSAMLVLLALSVPLQVLLALLLGAVLFVMTALFSALLCLPLILGTSATPPVDLHADGLTLRPWLWPARRFTWAEVAEIRDYPLLPSQDGETLRRYMVGRKHYQPAEGIMLIVPGLPLNYRVVGFFAGADRRPTVALTNRSHADYVKLRQAVRKGIKHAHADTASTD